MKPVTTVLMLIVLVGCFAESAHADRQSREEEKARQQRLELQQQQVESILRQETAGQVTDRKAALKEVLASGEAPDEAYWQAGYIRQGDKWVSVADRWLTPEQERELEEYTKARYNYADSDEGQYKLAQWCAEQGFEAQAYAHLKAVLLNNPDHAGLRQMLGYQQIGNRWMNQEEFQVAFREADRLANELQQWGPKLVEIRDGLNSGIKQKQAIARNRLKDVDDVAAIPAMELILLPSSDLAAAACVEQLIVINHPRSSIALCKAAMFLPQSAQAAKQSAIDELRTRPLDDFVPVLLGKMQTPLMVKYQFLIEAGTEFSHGPFNLPNMYRIGKTKVIGKFSLRSETMYELRNHALDLLFADFEIHWDMVERNGAIAMPYWQELNRKMPMTFGNQKYFDAKLRYQPIEKSRSFQGQFASFKYLEKTEELAADAAAYMVQVNRSIDYQNEQIRQINENVTHLLGQINETSLEESPEYWWNWWKERIEVEVGQKQEREVKEILGESLHLPFSCFTAGTPVWTDRGARPIEELKIGDMVLSQDVETGELAYRPIIRTTTREPKPLVTIDLGVEQIVSTGGHPFFVFGEGWVRARELQAGQILHTPTGSIPIVSVTETPDQETYNLVVDSDHTYFVGMSQVLVHDVSITSPTDAIVPGLLNR